MSRDQVEQRLDEIRARLGDADAIVFEPAAVRVEEVHRRAKSLLKINH